VPKLTFDEAISAINDERSIDRNDIQSSALKRRVYTVLYSAPGCLPDNSAVFETRGAALDYARELYADDAPRGFMAALLRYGIAPIDAQGYYRVEVCKLTLADLF